MMDHKVGGGLPYLSLTIVLQAGEELLKVSLNRRSHGCGGTPWSERKGISGFVKSPSDRERSILTPPMRDWWTTFEQIIGGKWSYINVRLSGRESVSIAASGKIWWHDMPNGVVSTNMKTQR